MSDHLLSVLLGFLIAIALWVFADYLPRLRFRRRIRKELIARIRPELETVIEDMLINGDRSGT